MEEWKDIEGFEGYYQVSNLGRVKSLPRIRKTGTGYYVSKTKILTPSLMQGYVQNALCMNGKAKSYRTHRLVAFAFIPNPENKPCINHKNSIRSDNWVENLEWCTRAENTKHAMENGRMPVGEKSYKAKLNEFQVRVIRKITDISNSELAKMWGVSKDSINCIRKNKTWKHLLKINVTQHVNKFGG